MGYEIIESDNGGFVKAWIHGVEVEEDARTQPRNAASLPFIYKWSVALPDVHWGMGATIGSVIPTKGAGVLDETPLGPISLSTPSCAPSRIWWMSFTNCTKSFALRGSR